MRNCIWQFEATCCFPSSSSSLEHNSNHYLLLRKYWKAGNKIQKANLACSFIPPTHLPKLEISSKQYELVNTLAFNTELYRSLLPPTPFDFFFFFPGCTFLTLVSQSLHPSSSSLFFLFCFILCTYCCV